MFRMFVDTYKCMGSKADDDGVPVVVGFLPAAVSGPNDRPIVFYAGSVTCINSKLATFCSSEANRAERVCQLYKQAYLNDATLLLSRLLRAERQRVLHNANFMRALARRPPGYSRRTFDGELISLQDAYIEFLQTSLLGCLVEMGADLRNVPLHLLEPRELEVPLFAEDTDVVGNDFLAPETRDMVSQLDFVGDTLSRTQLAILNLIPPNSRIFGTMRMNQKTEIINMDHVKKQVQSETIASNSLVWPHYLNKMLKAALGAKFLEVAGPLDPGLDAASVTVPNFDQSAIKDPLVESEGLGGKLATTQGQVMGSVALNMRSQQLRNKAGSGSVVAVNSRDYQESVEKVRQHIEALHAQHRGTKDRAAILLGMRMKPETTRMMARALGLRLPGMP
jgi:hypothetical protein